jgi:fructose-1,6-bisphosphatase/inositol monophosphatase family enzyme
MAMSLEDALVSVWRQVMAEDGKTVTLNDERYPVRRTTRSKLREVDFKFEGRALRGVEQNASTSSRWAKLAQEGKKVMQFLSDGRYFANVVEGKATVYQSLRER